MNFLEKVKVIRNNSKLDIINYPISEAEINKQTGDPIRDTGTGLYKTTGTTYNWSIRAGETLEFPAYVADYLLSVYAFLTEVDQKVIEEEEPEEVAVIEEEEEEEEVVTHVIDEPKVEVKLEEIKDVLLPNQCNVCGFVARSSGGLASHKRLKHVEGNE